MHEGQLCWKQWSEPLQAIEGIIGICNGHVLLFTEYPTAEHEIVLAAVRLIRRVGGSEVSIIIGSPYPSERWIGPLKETGVDHVWFLDIHEQKKGQRLVDPGDRIEIEENLCPALHTRHSEKATLSVCGRRGDRMIIARHHFTRWCLANHTECPFWLGERKD